MKRDDLATAEHGLHWLLDALRTGTRLRGETFAVAETEILALQRDLWKQIQRGEITSRLAVDGLVREITRRLDERLALQRRRITHERRRRTRGTPRRPSCAATPSAGQILWPRPRHAVLAETPPWLLAETPVGHPRQGRAHNATPLDDDACRLRPCTHACPDSARGHDDVSAGRTAALRSEAFEVPGLRVSLERTPGVAARSPLVRSPADVAPLFTAFIGHASDREHLVAALLDAYDHVIGLTLIAVGNANLVHVCLADVYRPLVLAASRAYYLAHNHPSGRLGPSAHDTQLTRDLHEIGRALGIELRDHLILGHNGAYHSLRENGEAVAAWHLNRRATRAARAVRRS